jgi:HD domain
MNKEEKMRAKILKYLNYSFTDFCKEAPEKIKNYIYDCKKIGQNPKYHPEVKVYDHIVIVFNRAKRTGDINLMMASIFHDLGKVDTTEMHNGVWTSYNHDEKSAELVEKYKDWIESYGADYETVYYLVDQHMRAKTVDVMRKHKQEVFKSHELYPLMQRFTEFDNMKIDYSNDTDE